MILVLSLNTALDKTYFLPSFRLGRVHRPGPELSMAGGKGINVARVLKRLRQPALLLGCVAGHAGRLIREKVRREGIPSEWIELAAGESRQCLAILSGGKPPTEVNETGPEFTRADLERVRRRVLGLLPGTDIFVCAGTLPRGVPDSFYAELIDAAHRRGVDVALDTSGRALRAGLRARPRLVKPNQQEAGSIAGGRTPAQALEMLLRTGAQTAVLTLGARGLVAGERGNGRRWRLQLPRLDSVCAIGSGDTMMAGLLAGWREGWGLERTLREAAAMAAANTLVPGAGIYRDADKEKILPRIRLRKLRSPGARES